MSGDKIFPMSLLSEQQSSFLLDDSTYFKTLRTTTSVSQTPSSIFDWTILTHINHYCAKIAVENMSLMEILASVPVSIMFVLSQPTENPSLM